MNSLVRTFDTCSISIVNCVCVCVEGLERGKAGVRPQVKNTVRQEAGGAAVPRSLLRNNTHIHVSFVNARGRQEKGLAKARREFHSGQKE